MISRSPGSTTLADDDQLLALHEALDELATQGKQTPELAKLRCFSGLFAEEASEVLGISIPPAKHGWARAKE